MRKVGDGRPLLLLNVDGPLNPYAAPPHKRPAGYSTHRMRPTGRKNEANDWIGGHLGLPTLPFVDWPSMTPHSNARLHWKTRALAAYAEGRPFAWVDDELGPEGREWVQRNHDAPALLHWVSPRLGLLSEDFRALSEWAAELEQAA
ncbi:hypothetical protein ACIREO_35650 [Streptomyces sp. NPDC102441]|uniref:hypothetical protein n=1 Tax=Streptomyces sp. NPDC102441 TaxID=3366176 RepID=UPI00381FB65D